MHLLLDHVDGAFGAFYTTMLADEKLSIFFESDAQIIRLIEKQKEYFAASLTMSVAKIKSTYIKLGELHYRLNIPYIDFIKGTDILQEHFLIDSQKYTNSIEIMSDIFGYFKIMKAFTAKGYLNGMIAEDKKDIESFFEQATRGGETYMPRNIIFEKIEWLQTLLICIEKDEELDPQKAALLLDNPAKEISFLPREKQVFFLDLEKRIYLNTENLFYFLKKGDYVEILPLYTSLLNIYKLTLMMSNAITIEYASRIIEEMKLDSLTRLYRKDMFEELLRKEIAFANRDSDYGFCITYIDLDDFKHINDSFGHYSGDKVIEHLGQVIRENIRASDIGFRIGGDEFAVIFKQADLEDARHICERIHGKFASYEFTFTPDIKFRVGLSMGIIRYTLHDTNNIPEILERVDNKLYEAKNSGKNRIAI